MEGVKSNSWEGNASTLYERPWFERPSEEEDGNEDEICREMERERDLWPCIKESLWICRLM